MHKHSCDLPASKNYAKTSDFTWIYWIHLNTSSRESTPDRLRCPDQRRHVGRTGRQGKVLEEEKNPKEFKGEFLTGCLRATKTQGPSGFSGGNRTLDALMGLIIFRWIVGISQNWEHKVHDFKLTNCHSMAAAGWANVFHPSRIFFGQPNPMVIMMLIYMVMNNL